MTSSPPAYFILPIEFQEELHRRGVPLLDIVYCEYWREPDRFRYAIRMEIKKPPPNLVSAMYASGGSEHRIEFIDEADLGKGP